MTGSIGADQDGYPWILGYRGPTLSELSGASVVRLVAEIEAQMAIKSEAEIALIRESIRWSNLAHRLLQRYTRVGVTETEVSQRASDEATFAMLDAIGEIYSAQSFFSSGASAGYRGQIGRNSAIPHALGGNLVFAAGDVSSPANHLVLGLFLQVKQTMFVGEPSAEQGQMFDHMLALQDLAFAAIRPGRACSEVDLAVRAYFDEHDLWPHWRHHTRPCDRPSVPRGAVPRLGGRHRDPPSNGVHGRARSVLAGARRLPALGHRPCDRCRHRDPHVLPARHREPRHSGIAAFASGRV